MNGTKGHRTETLPAGSPECRKRVTGESIKALRRSAILILSVAHVTSSRKYPTRATRVGHPTMSSKNVTTANDGTTSPVSSSKKKLIDAIEQDENFQRIVMTSEIIKVVSERIVTNTMKVVIDNILEKADSEKSQKFEEATD